jgi:hypothetical protein
MQVRKGASMKIPNQQSDSLKKALKGSRTFDEADYYQSKTVEVGGDDMDPLQKDQPGDGDGDDDELEDEYEDHEFYSDD